MLSDIYGSIRPATSTQELPWVLAHIGFMWLQGLKAVLVVFYLNQSREFMTHLGALVMEKIPMGTLTAFKRHITEMKLNQDALCRW